MENLVVYAKRDLIVPGQPAVSDLAAANAMAAAWPVFFPMKADNSARNPAVVVRLHGMAVLPGEYWSNERWTSWAPVAFANTVGVTAPAS